MSFHATLTVTMGLLLPASGFWSGGVTPATVRHDTHVTYGRMVVDSDVAFLQIRMFKDDLTLALRHRSGIDSLTLQATPAVDSLFLAYLADGFVLKAGQTTLSAAITSSGEDEMRSDGGPQDIWWYELEYGSEAQIDEITFNNHILFETFPDQRNILKVLDVRTDTERSYYFASGDFEEQTMRVGAGGTRR